MNKQAFLQGFTKQAQLKGINPVQAELLAKHAGFWGGVGDVASGVGHLAYDTIARPAVGMVKDYGRTAGYLGTGQWGKALNAGGSFVGNSALTALNFIPGAGLGGAAIRGGIGAARLGAGAAEAGYLGARAAGMGAKAIGGLDTASNAFRGFQGAAQNTLMRGTGNVLNTAGQRIANVGSRMGQYGKDLQVGGADVSAMQGAGNMTKNLGFGLQRYAKLGFGGAPRPGVFGPHQPSILADSAPGMLGKARSWGQGYGTWGVPVVAAQMHEDQMARNPYGSYADYFEPDAL